MAYALHFAATMLACWLTAQVLAVSTWTWRAPRVAIVCWQAVGLALGLSAMGLPMALGLAAYDRPTGSALLALTDDLAHGTLPAGVGAVHLGLVGIGFGIGAVLLTTTVRSVHAAVRAQRRHRDLLTLVARHDPTVPGALVLDHPSAAAYCLPGVRPRVVVSAGTLSLLDRAELAAVLTHERAHAQERHDLVLLPFTALCRALPWFRWVRDAHERVALLVEMRADDKARELHAEEPLAGALRRFAAAGHTITPAGTLGIGDRDLDVRVQRLLVADRPPRLLGGTALAVAATLVALPISLFLS
ncbi:M56 family metallopeptidase [Micromonospora auratinigra]|uniref:Zn-dependent protease with chaperone function n=1 Tax=Micromonospora auratinigra TaxID=261654 RepID=A0A1A9A5N3_9ACTN|nr:M56 family metallopeptidase [Micromonospora auratinigra]SBT51771.1 Zn-dependent protease with chaperone function [Micromonospora auratinigra]